MQHERLYTPELPSLVPLPRLVGVFVPPRGLWGGLNHGMSYELKSKSPSHKFQHTVDALGVVEVDPHMIESGELVVEEVQFNREIINPVLTACSKARQKDPRHSDETDPNRIRVANDVVMYYRFRDGSVRAFNKPDPRLPDAAVYHSLEAMFDEVVGVTVVSADAAYHPASMIGIYHVEQATIDLRSIPKAFLALYFFGPQRSIEAGLATHADFEQLLALAALDEQEIYLNGGFGTERVRSVNAGAMIQRTPFRNAWVSVNGQPLVDGEESRRQIAQTTLLLEGMTTHRLDMLLALRQRVDEGELRASDMIIGDIVEGNTAMSGAYWAPLNQCECCSDTFMELPTYK